MRWPARNLWRIAHRAARSGHGVAWFEAHPELWHWYACAEALICDRLDPLAIRAYHIRRRKLA